MPCDNMAVAVDWLDAYREKSFDIVDLYNPDAVLACACGTAQMMLGTMAIKNYWRDRFEHTPALDLVEIVARGDHVVSVFYRTPVGVVEAVLGFDEVTGKIAFQSCGPSA
jgi:hypothetical protein